jgi:hypothetical protein
MSQARRLDCAETWAGNEGVASLVELPGCRRGCIRSPPERKKREAMSTTCLSARAALSPAWR